MNPRGGRKEGGRRDNQEEDKPEEAGDKQENEEATTETPKVEEEEKVEAVEEEEPDVYISLEDYEKTKKTVKTNEARGHIAITDKNVQEDKSEKQRTEVLAKKAIGGEGHAIRPGQGAELMGF